MYAEGYVVHRCEVRTENRAEIGHLLTKICGDLILPFCEFESNWDESSDFDQSVPHRVVLLLLPIELLPHRAELVDDLAVPVVAVVAVLVAHRWYWR